jgi:hypothetical protein
LPTRFLTVTEAVLTVGDAIFAFPSFLYVLYLSYNSLLTHLQEPKDNEVMEALAESLDNFQIPSSAESKEQKQVQ